MSADAALRGVLAQIEGFFKPVPAHVKPLALDQLRNGDSIARKAQLVRHHPKQQFCIVAGCCTVAPIDGVLCYAHRIGGAA